MTEIMGRLPDGDFWRGRRVLVTGHTGFKGSWLCAWLDLLGAETQGVSLPGVATTPNLWGELGLDSVHDVRANISSAEWQAAVLEFQPEIIFHLAAQALVSVGYADPEQTFTTNVQGSVRLLGLLTQLSSTLAALMITTDKVYDTRQPMPFVEASYLGGRDPYSASKAAMELVVHSWPELPFPVATARAGNVIGGGDWSKDRLVPDLLRSWSAGLPLLLRRPKAVRPWQHVLEPIRGYLLYAEELAQAADVPHSLNLGPSAAQCVPVEELVGYAASVWDETNSAQRGAEWVALAEPSMRETDHLILESSLAQAALRWANALDWRRSVHRTIKWHQDHSEGKVALDLVRNEIASYSTLLEGAR